MTSQEKLEATIAAYIRGGDKEKALVVNSKAIEITVNGRDALRFLGKDARATYMIDDGVWTDYVCRG